jgi:hypothetical protein
MFFSSCVGGGGEDEADRVDGREEVDLAASWAWIRWIRADLLPVLDNHDHLIVSFLSGRQRDGEGSQTDLESPL